MKTLTASFIALALFAGAAQAASIQPIFTDLNASAPNSIFADVQASAPRSPFDELQASAPRSVFADIQASAPRADVFTSVDQSAP